MFWPKLENLGRWPSYENDIRINLPTYGINLSLIGFGDSQGKPSENGNELLICFLTLTLLISSNQET